MARRDSDDDQPWLAEGVREEQSTLVPRARVFGGGLIVVLLAVLVALGVYFAAARKSDGSRGYATPAEAPLIDADTGPYKVAPDHPGGAQITGIDDTIAAAASGRDPGSALLPDTNENPLPRPVAGALAKAPTDLLATVPATDARIVAPPVDHAPPTKPPAPHAAATPVVPPPAKPASTSLIKPTSPAARPVDPLAASADVAARAAKFDPAEAAPAEAKSGSVTLQLGAFSTAAKADAAWIKAGTDGVLSGLTKRVEPVDHDGTTLYRLRAGGVASPDAGRALCARLKAAGAACIVAS